MKHSPSQKPSFHYEGVDKIYPDRTNSLRKAGLAPPIFPTMVELWKDQDEDMEFMTKNNLTSTKRKTEMSIFALHIHTIFLLLSTG